MFYAVAEYKFPEGETAADLLRFSTKQERDHYVETTEGCYELKRKDAETMFPRQFRWWAKNE